MFSRLGYGHKARLFYVLWTAAIAAIAFGVQGIDKGLVFGVWVAGLLVLYFLFSGYERVVESPVVRKSLLHGQGGSARWAGSGTFAKYEYKKGMHAPIYLGRALSKYDTRPGGRDIAVDDENHMVTFGQNGSGKSTTVIWPNLVKYAYPDSVFVLDPKGEHAQMTAQHRAEQGQRIVVLDPMHETSGLTLSRFNPLDELDTGSIRIKEDIQTIANACLTETDSNSGTEAHFNETFSIIFSGLIAHVLTTEPPNNRNLPRVYDLFKALDGPYKHELITAMTNNNACGNVPSDSMQMFLSAGEKERGSFITTALRNIGWIASDAMREHLQSNEQGFRLSQLRTEKTSLYVVLPFDKMDPKIQGRYMRILMLLAFKACRDTPLPAARSKRRTLFILDEVSMLGKMAEIDGAYKTLRGYNVKLWAFYQQYSGLAAQSADVNAVMGNSSKQFFGCNDPVTAEKIEGYLGQYKHRDGVREMQRSLLDRQEILDTLGQTDMVQIVITGEGDKMELSRRRFIPGNVETEKSEAIFQVKYTNEAEKNNERYGTKQRNVP